jgi:5-methylcytosine-specific restriction endonuclease McrA
VNKRFKKWLKVLEDIVGSPRSEIRAFTYKQKTQLFNEDSTCSICKQRILNIDDAEVDHIIPYVKGGQTDISNAQLTHRFCNRQKSKIS